MSLEKDIAGILPGLMATGLVAQNMKALQFNKKTKLGMNKPKNFTPKKLLKLGTTNIVGVALIGATAGGVNALK